MSSRFLRALAAVMILGLAGAANADEDKLRLLVMDLKVTGGLDAETAALVGDLISVALSDYDNLEVFSGADVKRMVELEADKAAAGCEDDSSCLADLAGALGARYVIYGRIGKLGSRNIVTLNLFDADQAKAVERTDIKAADLDELGDRLNETVGELVRPLVGGASAPAEEPPPKVETPPPAEKGGSSMGLILIGAGVTTALVGGLVDFLSPTSSNGDLDGVDFVGPVAYLAGAGLVIGGLVAGGE